jgi:hypothetical protein
VSKTEATFMHQGENSAFLTVLVERGRNAHSFETLDKIAKRLRISVSDLFAFDCK